MKLAECIRSEFRFVQSKFAQVPDQPCLFYCPNNHARASDMQFDCFNCTKSIWCSDCKGCHSSTSYTCSCGIAWHTCTVHFAAASQTRVLNKPVQPERGQKRPLPIAASASAKRRATLEPNLLNRACLGPRLAARFPHLVSGEPQPRSTHSHEDCPRDQQHSLHRTLSPTHT